MSYYKFHDNHSGGGLKTGYDNIYIEVEDPRNKYEKKALETVAREIFLDIFKRNPDNVSCNTCGTDFSIDKDLAYEEVEKDINDPWYAGMASIIIPIDGRNDATKRIIKGQRKQSRWGKWNDESDDD